MLLPHVPDYRCLVSAATEPWPENATLYQQLRGRFLFTIKTALC